MTPRATGIVLSLGLLLVLSVSAGADEPTATRWPTWRGDAAMTGRSLSNPGDELMLLWRQQTGKRILSSAVIADGVVYVGGEDEYAYAFDLATGRRRWSRYLDSPILGGLCVHDGRVYVPTQSGVLTALDARTGEVAWTVKTDSTIVGGANVHVGSNRSLVIFGSYDNRLRAVDARTGEIVWTVDTENYVNGSAALSGETLVFGSCDSKLRRLDVRDGRPIWSRDLGFYIPGTCAIDGTSVYTVTAGGTLYAVDLNRGEIRWKKTLPRVPGRRRANTGDDTTTSLVLGDLRIAVGPDARSCVFTTGGNSYRADLRMRRIGPWTPPPADPKPATELIFPPWPTSQPTSQPATGPAVVPPGELGENDLMVFASPAVALGRVVIATEDDAVCCCDAKTGELLWMNDLVGGGEGSCVILAGSDDTPETARVVVVDRERISLLRLGDGKRVWRKPVGAKISASPAVADGRIVIGAEDGWIYCFGPRRLRRTR